MKKFALSVAAVGFMMLAGTPAMAATVLSCPATFTASPGFVGCKYVEKNALGNAKVGIQEEAIESLLGVANYAVTWSAVDASKSLFSYTGDGSTPLNENDGILTSTMPFFGQTIIGIHFGNSNPAIGNATAFFLFNFAAPTSSINLALGKGFSVAGLYETGRVPPPPPVPEPATWAMLILGFGAVGGAMRSASKRRTTLAFG